MDESCKALVIPVEISGADYMLVIAEKDFDMVKIPSEKLQNGVIIPEYFSELWNVKIGGELTINGYNAVVSAIVPQSLGLALYTGFDYINEIANAAGNKIPPVYNAIYGRSSDIDALSAYLIENGYDFTTVEDDKSSFDSIMDTMSVLIWFMIMCAVVLGFTVLYSVGLINLSAREYEYMFMGVMGYPKKSILAAHIKETVIQLVLAIPSGFVLGNIILESIKGEFSGGKFVISAAIFPRSYFIAALSVILVTALMTWVTSRRIEKFDIVEGLKAREE
jgi:putative ABC transport system permease protein